MLENESPAITKSLTRKLLLYFSFRAFEATWLAPRMSIRNPNGLNWCKFRHNWIGKGAIKIKNVTIIHFNGQGIRGLDLG